jgi:hypothetical protein
MRAAWSACRLERRWSATEHYVGGKTTCGMCVSLGRIAHAYFDQKDSIRNGGFKGKRLCRLKRFQIEMEAGGGKHTACVRRVVTRQPGLARGDLLASQPTRLVIGIVGL